MSVYLKENKAFTFPKLFFKYRSLTTKKDLTRLINLIQGQYLFCPTIEQLNDPFEGMINPEPCAGFAGAWYYHINDLEFPHINSARKHYRILSLSSSCFSPTMWAHYSDECKGVCLCYLSHKSLSNAKPVEYSSADALSCGNIHKKDSFDNEKQYAKAVV